MTSGTLKHSKTAGLSPAAVLNQKLTEILNQHHEWLDELQHEEREELVRLRIEVNDLRREVEKLRAQALSAPSSLSTDLAGAASSNAADSKVLRIADSEPELILTPVDPRPSPNGALDAAKFGEYGVSSSEGIGTKSCPLKALRRAGTVSNVRALRQREILDLKARFRDLDPGQRGYISLEDLADVLLENAEEDEEERQEVMLTYRLAIFKLNRELGILPSGQQISERKAGKFHIYFPTFEAIMLDDLNEMRQNFGANVTNTIGRIRHALIRDFVVQNVARTLRLNKQEVIQEEEEERLSYVVKYLEPVTATMIIANSLCMGMSLDIEPGWEGWFYLEILFLVYFLLECFICLRFYGWKEYFLGPLWAWNWFDFVIVFFALADFILILSKKLNVMHSSLNFREVLLLRILRIVRVARLIRILRLKLFKELTLMVNGVIAGLRTLFWAVVLLTMFIYAIGVLMRQVMDPENLVRDGTKCNKEYIKVNGTVHFYELSPSSEKCVRGAGVLHEYGPYMWSSVPRAMLALFMCFTDGCASPDGTPFIWHLWDTHGPLLVIAYVCSFMFITFGVLNLILAVFVENTLANAKHADAERQFGSASSSVQKAQELHMLLNRFCTAASDDLETLQYRTQKTTASSNDGIIRASSSRRGVRRLLHQVKQSLKKNIKWDPNALIDQPPLHLMRVTQEQFEQFMMDEEVNHIFDDLDISCISRDQLFDILDADGNGFLTITELMDGIMKLRGPPDKGDGVASVLMIRQVQKQLSNFEVMMHQQFQQMEDHASVIQSILTTKGIDNIKAPMRAPSGIPMQHSDAVDSSVSTSTI